MSCTFLWKKFHYRFHKKPAKKDLLRIRRIHSTLLHSVTVTIDSF